jgi:hypothetical protein
MISSLYKDYDILFRSKKRVTFASCEREIVDNSIPSVDDLTDEDHKARYLSQDDFKEIRLHAKLVTRDIRQKDPLSILQIETALHTARDVANEQKQPRSTEVTSYASIFYAWCVQGQGRGLEKYVSHRLRKDRSENAKLSTRTIVKISKESCYMNPEKLSQLCTTFSEPAVLYARMIAAADQVAAAIAFAEDVYPLIEEDGSVEDTSFSFSSSTEDLFSVNSFHEQPAIVKDRPSSMRRDAFKTTTSSSLSPPPTCNLMTATAG